jgi:hypothetical protein
MIRKPAVLFALSSFALTAQVSHTETVDFAPGGTIRFNNSFGELYVEGWDRPQVEMTFIRSRVRITTEHPSANELAISTVIPSHSFLRHPFGGKGDVTVRYELRVPRDSHLIIHHGGGNILVGNVTGSVEATNRNGDILLMLPGPGPYSIDAKSKMGTVTSDFAGKTHVRHFIGEGFASADVSAPRRIFLRVGFGGITIKEVPREALP